MSGPGTTVGASSPTTAVVCGNPRPGSRTLQAGLRVASGLTGAEPDLVVDLATVGPGLLDWSDPAVDRLVTQVGAADLVVVASPTYKATYSGLLKLFLDRFSPQAGTGLGGVAVALMVGAGTHHALAAELALRPLLVEVGATVAVPGLFVPEADHADPAAYEAWLARARPVVDALLVPAPHPRGAVA